MALVVVTLDDDGDPVVVAAIRVQRFVRGWLSRQRVVHSVRAQFMRLVADNDRDIPSGAAFMLPTCTSAAADLWPRQYTLCRPCLLVQPSATAPPTRPHSRRRASSTITTTATTATMLTTPAASTPSKATPPLASSSSVDGTYTHESRNTC